jgi:hypothetical protein
MGAMGSFRKTALHERSARLTALVQFVTREVASMRCNSKSSMIAKPLQNKPHPHRLAQQRRGGTDAAWRLLQL